VQVVTTIRMLVKHCTKQKQILFPFQHPAGHSTRQHKQAVLSPHLKILLPVDLELHFVWSISALASTF